MTRTTISEEIKQTRPFRSKSQETAVALLRTSHLVKRKLEAIVSSEGLTSQQYNVLRILRGARAPLPTMEISDRMIETACGITRLIATLEEKGLLKREQWPGDRRQVLCQITPAGMRVLEKLESPMDELDDTLTGDLTPEQVDTVLEALSVIREQVS
ncbi:MAG TPA: winged helix DNA-binding protein [Thermoanaerobaculia bacterium]|jgi:MarR family 2-MHQ and catechol resistance regulon transcriptional repressor|nr:winged helix DNA-binding protein [Thermoanaerobaculia bacterium]